MFRLGSSLFIAVLCFTGTSAMAQSTANLTDPQIAQIAYTAGEIDIAAADLALKKTSNNAVKAFANEMVRDHTAVKQKGTSKTSPFQPPRKSDSKLLDSERGMLASFDKAYAENEVA